VNGTIKIDGRMKSRHLMNSNEPRITISTLSLAHETTMNTMKHLLTPLMIALLSACASEPAEVSAPEAPLQAVWIYFLADGTDVEDQRTAVPHLDTAVMGRTIDLLRAHAGGKVWMSWVDQWSRDNQVLYLDVPVPPAGWSKPERNALESDDDYGKRIAAMDPEREASERRTATAEERFRQQRAAFLNEAHTLLEQEVYRPGHPQHRWSDVHGALNGANRVLTRRDRQEPFDRLLVCWSDLYHNVGKDRPVALEGMDPMVRTALIWPNAEFERIALPEATVLEHPDRAWEMIEDAILNAR
jgi:hypothetical protein